jgi:hypothetical protein
MSGSTEITSFAGETIKVSIPYTLKAGENKNAIIVYYIDNSGAAVPVTGIYNEITKNVDFFTKHLSKYAIGYNYIDFSDIKQHWGKDSIYFVSAREIFSGVGNNKFRPDQTMTRGMLVTVLGKIANADLSQKANFIDVSVKKYYSPYFAWAASNGIIGHGVVDNRIEPDRAVSREELAIILNNFIKYMNLKLKNVNTISKFSDDEKISSWASEAVANMQMFGLIDGKSNNTFDPKGTVTRAEVATILKELVESSFIE